MDVNEIRIAVEAEISRMRSNRFRVATEAGLAESSLRRFLQGGNIGVDKLIQILSAVDLECVVQPRVPRLIKKQLHEISDVSPDTMTPVADRDLAEMIAVLADAWEASDPKGRGHLQGRFDLAFQRERAAAATWPGARLARLARD